jgi:CRP/FNR family cyclic AMP-dependent transcriptional regulator
MPSKITIEGDDNTNLVKSFKSEITSLRQIPMFADLADADLAHLCQVALFRHYPAHSILLEEGVMNDALYIIRSGSVEFLNLGANSKPFLRLGRGRFFGQVSMFDPSPCSATVRAETDADVIILRSKVINELQIARPEVGTRLLMAIIQDFAKRHRSMIQAVKNSKVATPIIEFP